MLKALLSLVIFITVQIVSTLAALLWSNRHLIGQPGTPDLSSLEADPVSLGQGLLVGSLLTFPLLYLMGLIRKDGLKVNRARSALVYVLGIAAFLFLSFGINFIVQPLGLDDYNSTALFQAMCHDAACLLLLCVVGPLTEEFIFREGILRSLAEKHLPPVMAALASALLFAIVHNNPAQALPAGILGFILGLFYLRSGHLLLCCMAHVLHNTVAIAIYSLPEGISTFAEESPLTSVLTGSLFLALGTSLFYLWWKRTEPVQLHP